MIKKHIAIVGLGSTGIALARFFIKRGESVVITDIATREALGKNVEIAEGLGVQLDLGGHTPQTFDHADRVILSPGVPHTIAPLQRCREKGIPVVGEIEVAFDHIQEPIIAITGTNGKTTTTRLVGDMLAASGKKVFVGGNIGNPLIEYVDTELKADIVVAEISSFQLDTTVHFKPHVAVILNITEDHLDRYEKMDAYARSKRKIVEHQEKNDIAVLNMNDPYIHRVLGAPNSQLFWFNQPRKDLQGAFVEGKTLWLNTNNKSLCTISLEQTQLIGKHNQENIAAAALSVLMSGGNQAGIQHVVNTFHGLSHRIEYVDTVNGVRFYDDSKGTNVDAVLRSLECFDAPVLLILGGRDKGGDYTVLKPQLKRCVKKVIAMGEAKDIIFQSLKGIIDISLVKSMEEAVFHAYDHSVDGDVVLMSPACSSFDCYRNYKERGTHFCNLVSELKTKIVKP